MDKLSTKQKNKRMQAIKGKDSRIELMLRQELWKRGLRHRKNVKDVYGHPDIAFISKKIAIFCDGEFWHGYDWEHQKRKIGGNRVFWYAKIERNIMRDAEVNEHLRSQGWIVLRFWGEEIKKNTAQCADIIEAEYYKMK